MSIVNDVPNVKGIDMFEAEETERGDLLLALRGYLEELRDSGVMELEYAQPASAATRNVSDAPSSPTAGHSADPGALPEGSMPVTSQAAATASESAPTAPPAATAEHACSAFGSSQARLLFVMSGAGYSGEAGGLLANIIKAMERTTEQVCLLTFSPDAAASASAAALRSELNSRIAAVAPEVIVVLGDAASRLLLEPGKPVSALRGTFRDLAGTPVMASLHPEELLKNPALKRDVWNDMQQVMKRLAS